MVGLHSSNGAFHVPGDLGFRAVSNMGFSLSGQPARVEFSSDNSLICKQKQHRKNSFELNWTVLKCFYSCMFDINLNSEPYWTQSYWHIHIMALQVPKSTIKSDSYG